MGKHRFTRRGFLIAGSAAGLVIGFGLYRTAKAGGGIAGTTDERGANLSDWVEIAPDGKVTVRCGHSEMGQGVFTGIGTLIAEELECPWSDIQVETGPMLPSFTNIAAVRDLLEGNVGFAPEKHRWIWTKVAAIAAPQVTGGSSAIAGRFDQARAAGALARSLLLAAAAAEWGVDPAACEARDGVVHHPPSQRQKTYGELAARAAAMKPPAQIALKPRSAWHLIGTALPRVDTPAKIDGSARYGIDMRRPNMLSASATNCPVFGGRLKSVDASEALALRGVAGVHPVPGGVAVLADSTWHARQGLAALKVEWDAGPNAALDSAEIDRRLKAALDGKRKTGFAQGDAEAAFKTAARLIDAEYRVPYLAHATMEPMNCTAEVSEGGVDVWVPTQAQTKTREAAAKAAGVSAGDVRIHTTFLGGGFGRRLETDVVVQAVVLAKLAKRPVQVIWSREEDIQHDFYRPAALLRLTAGLGADGMPVAWRQQIASQSIMARVFPPLTWLGPDPTMLQGAVELPYAIPHQRVELGVAELPVPVASWRSVGHSITAFAKESFMDELAHAAGIDPLVYRMRLLKDQPRLARVLSLAAEKAGWEGQAAGGGGSALGLALHTSFESAVAQVAEVAVGGDGALRVKRVVAAVDCGTVVNPDIVRAQVEGAIVYGLSAALFGRITLDGGRVVQQNFPDYEMVRLSQMPAVEVHIVESIDPPGGIGEPGLPPAAPAVANAIFAATGKRVRALPLIEAGFTA